MNILISELEPYCTSTTDAFINTHDE